MKHQPSRTVRKILRWFVNAEFVEEIEGDLDELFYERLSTRGWLKAQICYLLDVLQAIRPYQPKRKTTKVGHEILNWIFSKIGNQEFVEAQKPTVLSIFLG